MKYNSYLKSQIGILEIVANNQNILAINFVKKIKQEKDNTLSKKCVVQLKEYFEGKRKTFDVPIKLSGTIWQNLVWQKLSQIPYGHIISYKDLAIMADNKKAARATGQAVNKNKLPIIIPCHRVVSSDGNIGGFAQGINTKKSLLELEKSFD